MTSTLRRMFALVLLESSATARVPQVKALKDGSWIYIDTSKGKRIFADNGMLGTEGVSDCDVNNPQDWSRFQIVHYQDVSAGAYGKTPQDNLIRDGDRVHILCNIPHGSTFSRECPTGGCFYGPCVARYLTVFPSGLYPGQNGCWMWNYSPRGDNFGFMCDSFTWQTFEVCKKKVGKGVDPIVRSNDQISLKPCISPRIFMGDCGGDRRVIGDNRCFKDAIGVDNDGNFYCSEYIGEDQLLTVQVQSDWEWTDVALTSIDYDIKNMTHYLTEESIHGADLEITNDARIGGPDVTKQYTVSVSKGKKVSQEHTEEFSATVQVGMKATIEEGVPLLEEGKVTMSGQISTEGKSVDESGMEWDESQTVTFTTTIECPPQQRVEVISTQQTQVIKVPMVATYITGEKISLGNLVISDGQDVKDDVKYYQLGSDKPVQKHTYLH